MKWHSTILIGLLSLITMYSLANPEDVKKLNKIKILSVLNEGLDDAADKPCNIREALRKKIYKITDLHKKIDPNHPCHQKLFNNYHIQRAYKDIKIAGELIEKALRKGQEDQALAEANRLGFHYDRAKLLVERQNKKHENRLARLLQHLPGRQKYQSAIIA